MIDGWTLYIARLEEKIAKGICITALSAYFVLVRPQGRPPQAINSARNHSLHVYIFELARHPSFISVISRHVFLCRLIHVQHDLPG